MRIASLCLLAILMCISASAQAGNAEGTITDTQTAPIAHADVRAVDINRQILYAATTNEAGNFEFRLPLGHYEIIATKKGFYPARETCEITANRKARIDLSLSARPTDVGGDIYFVTISTDNIEVDAMIPLRALDLSLKRKLRKEANSIAGVVTDPNGVPIEEAEISVIDVYRHKKFSTHTDHFGRFALRHVQAGRYQMKVALACPGITALRVPSLEPFELGASEQMRIDVHLWATTDDTVDWGCIEFLALQKDSVLSQTFDNYTIEHLPF